MRGRDPLTVTKPRPDPPSSSTWTARTEQNRSMQSHLILAGRGRRVENNWSPKIPPHPATTLTRSGRKAQKKERARRIPVLQDQERDRGPQLQNSSNKDVMLQQSGATVRPIARAARLPVLAAVAWLPRCACLNVSTMCLGGSYMN